MRIGCTLLLTKPPYWILGQTPSPSSRMRYSPSSSACSSNSGGLLKTANPRQISALQDMSCSGLIHAFRLDLCLVDGQTYGRVPRSSPRRHWGGVRRPSCIPKVLTTLRSFNYLELANSNEQLCAAALRPAPSADPL